VLLSEKSSSRNQAEYISFARSLKLDRTKLNKGAQALQIVETGTC